MKPQPRELVYVVPHFMDRIRKRPKVDQEKREMVNQFAESHFASRQDAAKFILDRAFREMQASAGQLLCARDRFNRCAKKFAKDAAEVKA